MGPPAHLFLLCFPDGDWSSEKKSFYYFGKYKVSVYNCFNVYFFISKRVHMCFLLIHFLSQLSTNMEKEKSKYEYWQKVEIIDGENTKKCY